MDNDPSQRKGEGVVCNLYKIMQLFLFDASGSHVFEGGAK
jgi:hypothetical protein